MPNLDDNGTQKHRAEKNEKLQRQHLKHILQLLVSRQAASNDRKT